MGKKLAIVCSHPIQYYAPLFRYLAKTIELEVIYCHRPSASEIGRSGFGLSFEWDVDLMSEYSYRFIENISKQPSMDTFYGCDTPSIGAEIKSTKATHVLILGWYLKSYIQAFLYCKMKNVPVAVRGDSQLNPLDSGWKELVKKTVYPLFLQQFTRILYVGDRNKEYLLHYGAKEQQLIFSPHSVDQHFWANVPSNNRKEHNLTTFLWVGKFIEKKRPFDVIRAFSRTEDENLRLVLVGTGELLEESKEIAKMDQRISFAGFKNQTELRDMYSLADCLVLTSDYRETWGLVVNESFSQTLPVIVSDACGCSAGFVKDDVNGFIYPMGNIEKLTLSIQNFALEKDQLCKKFKNNILITNKIYSFESNRNAIVDFLENVK